MAPRFLQRGDASLAYEVHGTSSASPPVLVTHGFGSSRAMWDGNVATLATGRQAVTWDVRGHGESSVPPDPEQFSRAVCLDDMGAILSTLSIDRAVLCGMSLGGYLSLAFCAVAPERVAGLVLVDTGPGYRDGAARARWNDYADRTASALEDLGPSALSASPELRVRDDAARRLALAARGILTQHDALVIDSLSAIAVPTLVVVGADDTAFRSAAGYMATRIPGASLEVIDGAGHAANIDRPERFNAAVAAFLSGLD